MSPLLNQLKNIPPERLQAAIRRLPSDEQAEVLELLEELELRTLRERCRYDFMAFVKEIWPDFIEGAHHRRMAKAFERLIDGDIKRLILNLPPRHTKSEFGSKLLPAWVLGKHPNWQIIQASHTTELAVKFGRDVRNMLDSDAYHHVFPDVELRPDSKAAGRWNTNMNGVYHALGVGSAMAGIGAHILVIDDPVSEQEAMAGIYNPEVYNKIYDWYTTGPRQRLQPDGRILLIQCVEGNQRVLMSDGQWSRMCDLKPGDSIAAWENGKAVPKKVLNHASQGEDDLLEVVSRSASLKVNARHPFLTVKNKEYAWTPAASLRPGDIVVHMRTLNNHQGLRAGYRPVRMDSSDRFTPEEYWLAGYMGAHGWLTTHRGAVTGFALPDNSSQKARDLIKTYYGLNIPFVRAGYYQALDPRRGKWLANRRLCTPVRGRNIPPWAYKLNAQDKREFLEGYLAHGSWLRPTKGATRTYQIGSTNPAMLDSLRLLARTCGVRVSKIYSYQNSKDPDRANYHQVRFSFKPDPSQPRKAEGPPHFRFEAIEAISPAGRGEVFDLQVEGAENFIAEGFVVHNTRWSKIDLTGQVLRAAAQRGGEQWEVIEFPAILPSGKSLWPEFWPVEQLEAIRDEIPAANWAAQYLQEPISETAAIIKREWWKEWEKDDPPKCSFIIQAWDTAYETKTVNDYSACQTWGVWYNDEDKNQPNLILLNAFKKRLEFPDLKARAKEEYDEWEPDSVIIEKEASGASLIQEMRRMGIPVIEYSPGKGQDKISRLNAVSDIIANGRVWVPKTRWAEDLVEEVASFPLGEYDDQVDVLTLVLMRYRQGGYLRLDSDVKDEIPWFKSHRRKIYY